MSERLFTPRFFVMCGFSTLIALIANLVPALRATRVDPPIALKAE